MGRDDEEHVAEGIEFLAVIIAIITMRYLGDEGFLLDQEKNMKFFSIFASLLAETWG